MTTIIAPDWPAPANVIAGTTTRTTPDDDLPGGLRCLDQVHGASVVAASDLTAANDSPQADAVVGFHVGDICAVRTADCLPVLFCSSDGSSVAAAHAGWRGLAAGVLENTVAALLGDNKPGASDLLVWLGPAISQANFEVGADVRAAFLSQDAEAAPCFEQNSRSRWQADLYGLARRRLAKVGVEGIYGGGLCTFADAERFYSYRRGQDTDRMVSFVGLKKR